MLKRSRGTVSLTTVIIAVVFIAIAAGVGMWLYSMYSGVTASSEFEVRLESASPYALFLTVANRGSTDIIDLQVSVYKKDGSAVVCDAQLVRTNGVDVDPAHPLRPGDSDHFKVSFPAGTVNVGDELRVGIEAHFTGGKVAAWNGSCIVLAH
ncbi:hypothetical protein B6U99_06910 [Candidatus Geothermarchaeota archaeon ex4572_27]|nr:MAG: hypothetical protein B6U99_06910 [Candidatus Geothermarchaeota archaeon ex4572_27]